MSLFDIFRGKKKSAPTGNAAPTDTSDCEAPALPPGVKLLRTLVRPWCCRGPYGSTRHRICGLTFDGAGQRLAVARHDDGAELWEVDSAKHLHSFTQAGGVPAEIVALDGLGQHLAIAWASRRVCLYDAGSGRYLEDFYSTKSGVSCLAIDRLGQWLAVAWWEPEVQLELRKVGSLNLRRTLEGHSGMVSCVAFDPTGQTLASGSGDSTVKLWEPSTGRLLRTLEGHSNSVAFVAFDPTGQTLATGSRDNTVKLWEVSTGKLIRTLETKVRSSVYRDSVFMFSADGRLFASSSGDVVPIVRLWRCDTWETVAVVEVPQASGLYGLAAHPTLRLLAYAPDMLLGCAAGQDIQLWELDSEALFREGGQGVSSAQVKAIT